MCSASPTLENKCSVDALGLAVDEKESNCKTNAVANQLASVGAMGLFHSVCCTQRSLLQENVHVVLAQLVESAAIHCHNYSQGLMGVGCRMTCQPFHAWPRLSRLVSDIHLLQRARFQG